MANCQISDWCPTSTISNSWQIRHNCGLTICEILAAHQISIGWWDKQECRQSFFISSHFPLFFHHWAARPKNGDDSNQLIGFVFFLPCVFVWDDWKWHEKTSNWKYHKVSQGKTLEDMYSTILLWYISVPTCNICIGTGSGDIMWESSEHKKKEIVLFVPNILKCGPEHCAKQRSPNCANLKSQKWKYHEHWDGCCQFMCWAASKWVWLVASKKCRLALGPDHLCM